MDISETLKLPHYTNIYKNKYFINLIRVYKIVKNCSNQNKIYEHCIQILLIVFSVNSNGNVLVKVVVIDGKNFRFVTKNSFLFEIA